MIVIEHFIWFMIYGFIGWIYETLAMTIYSGKWDNRGFLFGPIIPIYGFGALALTILIEATGFSLTAQEIFLVSVFGSVVLELSTSIILEKLFNAYWWDYSGAPFNFQGRICLFASLGFGLAGLIVYHIIFPFVACLTGSLGDITLQIIGLGLMGLLAADIGITVSDLVEFDTKVKEADKVFNNTMESLVLMTKHSRLGVVLSKSQQMTIGRVKGFINKKNGEQ